MSNIGTEDLRTQDNKTSSVAENSFSVTAKSIVEHLEPGFGAAYREHLGAAQILFDLKMYSEAEVILDHNIAFFEGSMNDTTATYVCVANREELIFFQREHPDTKNVIWLDWAFGEAIYKKAWSAVEQEQFDRALSLLEKAIAFSPYKARAYNERGQVLLKKNTIGEAGISFAKALRTSQIFLSSKKEEPIALRGVGYIYVELGDFSTAKALYEQSLELEPNNPTALNELEYIKLQTKQQIQPQDRFFESVDVHCPACHSQSDTSGPNKRFDLVGLCVAPQTDYVLWECKCAGCKTKFNGAYWTGNWAQELAKSDFDQHLVQCYQTAIDNVATLKGEDRNINGKLTKFIGSSEIDTEFLNQTGNENLS